MDNSTKKHSVSIRSGLKWFVWEFLGLHFMYHMLKPLPPDEENKLKPAVTFGLWIIGIYVALFGLASQIYDSKIGVIENRINAIISQMGTPARNAAISRIAITQNMRCPEHPEFLKIWTTFYTFIRPGTFYKDGSDQLKEIVTIWKDSLSCVNLYFARLDSIDLSFAHLEHAFLNQAHLEHAFLFSSHLDTASLNGAHLDYVDLSFAQMNNTSLTSASLNYANLTAAHLENAAFYSTRLEHAILSNTYFDNAAFYEASILFADSLKVNQLLKAKSLYRTKLDHELLMQVRARYPELLATVYVSGLGWRIDHVLLQRIQDVGWKDWREDDTCTICGYHSEITKPPL